MLPLLTWSSWRCKSPRPSGQYRGFILFTSSVGGKISSRHEQEKPSGYCPGTRSGSSPSIAGAAEVEGSVLPPPRAPQHCGTQGVRCVGKTKQNLSAGPTQETRFQAFLFVWLTGKSLYVCICGHKKPGKISQTTCHYRPIYLVCVQSNL